MMNTTESTIRQAAAPDCAVPQIHAAAVESAALVLPSDQTVHGLAAFFKILGDPTRIRILHALFASELCVCDIASLLSIGRSAASHQLATLRQANLVAYRRAGKSVYYRLSDDHVKQIVSQALAHTEE